MNSVTIEKLLMAGLGTALIAKERFEEAVDKLVNKGELTKEQAKGLFDDVAARAEGEKEKLEARGKEELRKFFKDQNLVLGDDLKKIEARLTLLEEKVQTLSNLVDSQYKAPETTVS